MEQQESVQPEEHDEGPPQLDPEVEEQQRKHAMEILERLKNKPSLYNTKYTFVEELAQEETTNPTDIMGLAILMKDYPGVTFGVGKTIAETEQMRKDQVVSLRYHAERTGKDIDKIYRCDKAIVAEILEQAPGLLNPYDLSQVPEIIEKVRPIVGSEIGLWLGRMVPNVVTGQRLEEIARVRLSQQLRPQGENTQ